MASLDWSQCPAVESVPGKVSGAWVFKDTRMPVSLVFENLEAGARIDEIKRSKPAQGTSEIRVPGEGSYARRAKQLAAGEVQIDGICWEDGLKMGRTLGVELPVLS